MVGHFFFFYFHFYFYFLDQFLTAGCILNGSGANLSFTISIHPLWCLSVLVSVRIKRNLTVLLLFVFFFKNMFDVWFPTIVFFFLVCAQIEKIQPLMVIMGDMWENGSQHWNWLIIIHLFIYFFFFVFVFSFPFFFLICAWFNSSGKWRFNRSRGIVITIAFFGVGDKPAFSRGADILASIIRA